MTMGDKIAAGRKKQNLTQEGLAELLDVSRQAVSRWESGTAYPEMDKVVRLCEILEINCDYLLKDDVTDSGVKIIEQATERTSINPSDIIRIVFGFLSLLFGIGALVACIILFATFFGHDGSLAMAMTFLSFFLIALGVLLLILGIKLLGNFKKNKTT